MNTPSTATAPSLFGRIAPWLLVCFSLGCYFLFLDSPGTPDVPDFWLRWMGLMREHGLVRGYAVAGSDYLPGAFTYLALIDHTARSIGCDVTFLLKMAIASSAIAGAAIFGWWSRNPLHAGLFLLALLFSSAAHGYLDSFYLPAMLAMVWSLSAGRFFWAGVFLGVALCFKWQPLLVAPFVAVYAVSGNGSVRRSTVWLVARFLLGVAGPVALQAAAFGARPLLTSFNAATTHHALSLQGLNINWVLQMALHHSRGLSTPLFELTPPPALALGMKALFFLVYLALVIALWARGTSFTKFLWCAMAGSFAYFAVNIGVHENHLFMTMILAFCLLAHRAEHAVLLSAYCAIAANLNLILFYGLQGRTPLTSAYTNPAAVCLSLVNTAFFGLCVYETFRQLSRRGERDALRESAEPALV